MIFWIQLTLKLTKIAKTKCSKFYSKTITKFTTVGKKPKKEKQGYIKSRREFQNNQLVDAY